MGVVGWLTAGSRPADLNNIRAWDFDDRIGPALWQRASINESTTGSTIYYTTEGSTPTTSSQVYSSPFTICASTTVEVMATASGFVQSGIASASCGDL
jgi:Chitobiase/beta-hexosaminidase C-terminal domain